MNDSMLWQGQPEKWTFEKLEELFIDAVDVNIKRIQLSAEASSEVVLLYGEGLTDTSMISRVVLPELEQLFRKQGFLELLDNPVHGTLPLISTPAKVTVNDLSEWIFQGDLLLFFPAADSALFRLSICHRPERTPEESSTEITIKGPKDGFTEDILTNVGLIRKRIRSQSLCNENFVVGRRTRTKLSLIYFQDILNPGILNEVRSRLNKIDIDGLYSINQLESFINDTKYSLFPLLDFTGRPDKVVASLLAGRFVIIVDGNPMVMIGPGSFSLLMKSPEDLHFNFEYVSFARLIRLLSFAISVLLPGAWVALSSFHPDQLPFRLMATIASSRLGLPFSGQLELFILLVLLEIFREAGLRLPSSIGQTLTVVGGLIIGDAAIRAGLVSPSVVVVGALTAVAGVTLVNQSLSGTVSVIRFVLFFIASFLGMYGLLLGIVVLVGYMCSLRSFGIPYMAPVSPMYSWSSMFKSVLRFPWRKMNNRPEGLQPIDKDRYKEE
ncbi:spore germination protein [Paenibacillus mendelii]|uniref:Spore germination protein n=1 Tax=Paenibacillus mendelii TaxID=206163 RepID=A0ABV6JGI0_9BACL|nr:spore germination protein [Paenibacillus mendelii]MCQ6557790.1 spore germination protein [Paenibacillus mendelii]